MQKNLHYQCGLKEKICDSNSQRFYQGYKDSNDRLCYV